MPTPVENYLDKIAAFDIAEKSAQDAINKIHAAANALTRWFELRFPNTPALPMKRALTGSPQSLPDWPSPSNIADKLRAYHLALAAVDEAYEAVPSNYRNGLRKPPAGHGDLRGG